MGGCGVVQARGGVVGPNRSDHHRVRTQIPSTSVRDWLHKQWLLLYKDETNFQMHALSLWFID